MLYVVDMEKCCDRLSCMLIGSARGMKSNGPSLSRRLMREMLLLRITIAITYCRCIGRRLLLALGGTRVTEISAHPRI